MATPISFGSLTTVNANANNDYITIGQLQPNGQFIPYRANIAQYFNGGTLIGGGSSNNGTEVIGQTLVGFSNLPPVSTPALSDTFMIILTDGQGQDRAYKATMGEYLALASGGGSGGIYITNAALNSSGHLIFTYSDGSTRDAGTVAGATIATIVINDFGHLIVTLSNGSILDAGAIPTLQGNPGAPGAAGNSVSNVLVNGSNHLIITLSNGSTIDSGLLPQGVGISSFSINTSNHLIVTLSNGNTVDAGALPVVQVAEITNFAINTAGHLVVSLSNGNTIDAGALPSSGGGSSGPQITSSVVNSSGHLIFTFSDGSTRDAGSVEGASITSVTVNSSNHLIVTLSDGTTHDAGLIPTTVGVTGTAGTAGATGLAGVSVSNAVINSSNHLIITLSNGNTVDSGLLPEGVGISSFAINGSGHLIVTLSNNTTVDAGVLPQGPAGAAGLSVSSVVLNGSGHLIFTFSDNTTHDAGAIPATVPGSPGVSVSSVVLNGSNHLIFTFSDGSTHDVGALSGGTGTAGANGISVTNAAINGSNHLILTFSDNSTHDVGLLPEGPAGTNGINGTNGRGITNSTTIDSSGNLILAYTDSNTQNLGKVVGNNGTAGINGTNGTAGINGTNGVNGTNGISISSSTIDSNSHLIQTLSNGTTIDAGPMPMLQIGTIALIGALGNNLSITNNGTVVNSGTIDGSLLTLTFTNGGTLTFGPLVLTGTGNNGGGSGNNNPNVILANIPASITQGNGITGVTATLSNISTAYAVLIKNNAEEGSRISFSGTTVPTLTPATSGSYYIEVYSAASAGSLLYTSSAITVNSVTPSVTLANLPASITQGNSISGVTATMNNISTAYVALFTNGAQEGGRISFSGNTVPTLTPAATGGYYIEVYSAASAGTLLFTSNVITVNVIASGSNNFSSVIFTANTAYTSGQPNSPIGTFVAYDASNNPVSGAVFAISPVNMYFNIINDNELVFSTSVTPTNTYTLPIQATANTYAVDTFSVTINIG